MTAKGLGIKAYSTSYFSLSSFHITLCSMMRRDCDVKYIIQSNFLSFDYIT